MLELYKKKKPSDKGYDTSFARNIHERTDMPVFSVSDAVFQIKKPDPNKSEVEISMDEWFINNLPMGILNADLDMDSEEDGIRASPPDVVERSMARLKGLTNRSSVVVKSNFPNNTHLSGLSRGYHQSPLGDIPSHLNESGSGSQRILAKKKPIVGISN
jgi:hypothetical protein